MLQTGIAAMVLGVALFSSEAAQADFLLGAARSGNASLLVPGPPSLPDMTQDAPDQSVSRFKMARGFGAAVPMSFAVRQIVPGGVKVRYGAGVDPEALVDWTGNRPWNLTLAAAVHPLHLRIVTGTDTVLIAR